MNVRTLLVVAAASTALLTATVHVPTAALAYAQTATQEDAINLVDQLGQKAVKLLSNDSLDDQAKREGFNALIDQDFDMPLIGKFVLGKHWRKATDEQKAEYQSLFKQYIVATYQKRIGDYSGENLKIIKAKPLNKKEFLVHSEIVRPKGPPVKLDWRVRRSKTGDGQKIIDIVVENVSMALTHREEFSAVISRNSAGVDGLIKKLRTHIGESDS